MGEQRKRPRQSPFRVAAVIPAAGAGIRMRGDRPKQFLELDGKPLLVHTLTVFEQSKAVGFVVLVVPEETVDFCKTEIVARFALSKVRRVVPGGARRQDSVRLGVEACAKDCDILIVHDGVRPLIESPLIERAVDGAWEHGAVIAALPATETIKEVDADGLVRHTPDRGRLWRVQTPQAFRTKDLLEAHRKAFQEGWEEMSDDALLLERTGVPVRVIRGEEENIKVTTPHDLEIARLLLKRRSAAASRGTPESEDRT
ncbi:MAG: 2-C-methyl-D-erythritol 4-phosphate cytidylyltransferase [Desulfobacteraceae bacterium]